MTLYFDADTGRLLKSSRTGKADDGSDAVREAIYLDYKAVGGMQVPHREVVTLGGTRKSEVVTEKYEPLEKLDDGEFAVD